jgi:hypothetical protein
MMVSQLTRSVPLSVLGIGLSEGSLLALERLLGMTSNASITVIIVTLLPRYVFAMLGLMIELGWDGKQWISQAIHASNSVNPGQADSSMQSELEQEA